jgi:hypothetical protein
LFVIRVKTISTDCDARSVEPVMPRFLAGLMPSRKNCLPGIDFRRINIGVFTNATYSQLRNSTKKPVEI